MRPYLGGLQFELWESISLGWNDRQWEKIGENREEDDVWLKGCRKWEWGSFLPAHHFGRKCFFPHNLERKLERKMGREYIWREITHISSLYLMLLFFFLFFFFFFFFLAGVELIIAFMFCFYLFFFFGHCFHFFF